MSDFFRSPDYWLLPELTTHLGFVLAVVFLAYLVQQKRSPSSTLAWLLLVLFVPYLGVPLYLMFGGRKMIRMARKKPRVYDHGSIRRGTPSDLDCDTERFLRSYGAPPAREGNCVEVLTRGDVAFQDLCRILEQATITIHITTYILGGDKVGKALVELLARKSASGVKVRLLLDAVGSWRIGRRFLAPLTREGAHVAYFMPVLHFPFRGRANLRNHRKIVVVDGRVALSGGMNLAGNYMGPRPDSGFWRDLSALIEGPAAADLDALFHSDWEFATGEKLTAQPEARDAQADDTAPPSPGFDGGRIGTVQVVASGPDVPDDPLYETLVSMIFAARERIWIVTPYFVPDEMLSRSLNLAARRGVDVRLIVPERSNHPTTDLAREGYLRDLHEAGGTILLYRPAMLHAKAVIFDDALTVIGSANMDNRSLFLNYEVALFLYSHEEVREVAAWAEGLQSGCIRELPKRGWARELAENIVRLFAPLL